MKVIVDANFLISYLLPSKRTGTIAVVESCFLDEIQLVLPRELATEVIEARDNKPYLRSRISLRRLNQVLAHLQATAEIPDVIEEFEAYALDPHDVEYLVIGDEKLLSLQEIHGIRIIDPVDFLEVLQQRGFIGHRRWYPPCVECPTSPTLCVEDDRLVSRL